MPTDDISQRYLEKAIAEINHFSGKISNTDREAIVAGMTDGTGAAVASGAAAVGELEAEHPARQVGRPALGLAQAPLGCMGLGLLLHGGQRGLDEGLGRDTGRTDSAEHHRLEVVPLQAAQQRFGHVFHPHRLEARVGAGVQVPPHRACDGLIRPAPVYASQPSEAGAVTRSFAESIIDDLTCAGDQAGCA